MRRHELTDEQWELVKPVLPRQREGGPGRKPADPRKMLNGMMWILKTGAPWRDLPERLGPWQTVYHHFNEWRKQSIYDRIIEALLIRLDGNGQIDWDLWCVDGSSTRASRAAAGASKKVAIATQRNRTTTHWAAREADSGASSTWLLTVQGCPWPSKSVRGRRMSRSTSSRS